MGSRRGRGRNCLWNCEVMVEKKCLGDLEKDMLSRPEVV